MTCVTIQPRKALKLYNRKLLGAELSTGKWGALNLFERKFLVLQSFITDSDYKLINSRVDTK